MLAICVTLGTIAHAQPTTELPEELVPYFNAIRQTESANYPWTIYDNTARKSYRLANRELAEAKAKELIALERDLDLGLMQLNCKFQCKRKGVTLDNIFDPEINVGIAKTVFMEFWTQARKVSTEFSTRIIATVGAYNNGKVTKPNSSYVEKVWRAMGKPVDEIPKDGTEGTNEDAKKPETEKKVTMRQTISDALGRASKRLGWNSDREEEIEKGKTDPKANPKAKSKKGKENDGAPTTTELLVGIFGTLGFLAGTIALVFGFIALAKIFGIKIAFNIVSSLFKSRSKSKEQED